MNIQFIPFDSNSSNPYFRSSEGFRTFLSVYWLHRLPGDFARPPVQSSGVLGQGATL